MGKSQYGFNKIKSWQTNLITSLNLKREVDVSCKDFCKAFSTVSHCLLLEKIVRYRLVEWL